MLQHYKGQNAVEKGFRFLKDKSFRMAEFYLKKEDRMMPSVIMVLALLILCYRGMGAQKTTEGDWSDRVEPARKAYSKANAQMGIPEV